MLPGRSEDELFVENVIRVTDGNKWFKPIRDGQLTAIDAVFYGHCVSFNKKEMTHLFDR